ncbi:MAG: hypothetical protein HYV26_19955 [Candidatus Hydrogenedentes bacterium]|nr:hypothetical protein [Candidatus Hydrogenedentota bacterium]MBI3119065.1 hypothetical protein [Candidatus Hydrogenedentota bacterium]
MARASLWFPFFLIAATGGYFLSGPDAQSSSANGLFGRGKGELTLARDAEAADPLVAALQESLPLASGLDVSVVDAGSSQDKLTLLSEGNADAALVRTGLGLEYAAVGVAAAAGQDIVHLVVPADSPLVEFRGLAGRRVGAGPPGSDADLLARRVFSYLHFAEPPQLVNDHQAELETAFLAGEIDAAFLVQPLLGPAVDRMLSTGYYRLLPVPEAEAIARVLAGVSQVSIPPNIYGPERSMPALEASPFPALAVDVLLVARHGVASGDLQALLSDIVTLTPDHSLGVVQFSLPAPGAYPGMRLHPAVDELLHRNDPVTRHDLRLFSARLFGLALLLIATVHGLFLWNRYYDRRRRKDMAKWFEAVEDIGARMEVAETTADFARLADDLASKQRLAERAWLGGNLDTPELLLLTLAHQVRVQDGLAKCGQPVERPTQPRPFPGAFAPEPALEVSREHSHAVVRPDFGEALVSTVRVRKREPVVAESEVVSSDYGPPPIADEYSEPQSAMEVEPFRREPQEEEHFPPEADDMPTPAGSGPSQEGHHRRGRRRGKSRHHPPHQEEEIQAPAPPAPLPQPAATNIDDEQMELFGKRG